MVPACQSGERPFKRERILVRFWRRDSGALAELARLLSTDDASLVAEVMAKRAGYGRIIRAREA